MTELEAREWLLQTFGARRFAKLEEFAVMLLAEAERQSLIARSTFDQIWSRHIADCAQLVVMAPPDGLWVDVGAGGGLPGMVVSILRDAPMLMVEPRRKRAVFLKATSDTLGLQNAAVFHGNVQAVNEIGRVVSARAVSSLTQLFTWTAPLVSRETLYLLPRGKDAAQDVDLVRNGWRGMFHVKQSITDADAGIVVAADVRRL